MRSKLGRLLREQTGLQELAEAGTVAEATALIEEQTPDLVLLDMHLPDGTGLDVLRHIRQRGGGQMVMVVTGFAQTEVRRKCVQLGAHLVFDKATEIMALIEAVREYVKCPESTEFLPRWASRQSLRLSRHGEELEDELATLEARLLRRELVLQAVGQAAKLLMRSDAWERGIEYILQQLGAAAGCTFAAIYQSIAARDSSPDQAVLLHAWHHLELGPRNGKALPRQLPCAGSDLARFQEALAKRRFVISPPDEGADEGGAVLHGLQARSLLAIPVLVSARLWGFLLFGSSTQVRRWDKGEVQTLQVAADTLAAAVERHQAELALERSLRDYKELELIVSRSRVVAYLCRNEPNLSMEFVSDSIRSFGYTPEEFMCGGRSPLEIIHPDDRERMLTEMNEYLAGGATSFVQEYRAFTRDGSVRWLRDETWPRRNASGEITHLQGLVHDITLQRTAEDALRESEGLFRSCFESGNVGIAIHSPDNQSARVNRKLGEILGYSAEELSTKNWEELTHPDDRTANLELQARCESDSQGAVSFDKRFIHKSGRVVYANVAASPVRRVDGSVDYFIAHIVDITDRKLTEHALRQSRIELAMRSQIAHAFLQHGDDGAYAAVMDAVCEYSQSSVGLFGYVDDDGNLACPSLKGIVWDRCRMEDKRSIFPPDQWGGLWGRALKTGETCVANEGMQVPEGHLAIENAVAVPLRSGDRILGVIVVANRPGGYGKPEVSLVQYAAESVVPILLGRLSEQRSRAARRKAEEQLDLHSAALEAAANAIVITDQQGVIRWVNPAFTEMTGYRGDEVIGQNPRVLKSGMQSREFYRSLWETILRGDVWSGSLVNQRKDGSHYVEEMTVTPVPDPKGGISHFIAVKQDVTERKRLERKLADERVNLQKAVELKTAELRQTLEEVQAINLRLAEANLHKNRFLSSMSHELRTPLNAVLGFADLMEGQHFGALNDKQAAYVRQIRESGKHLLDLISDLLDLAKIDAGATVLQPESFSLQDALAGAAGMFSERVIRKQLALDVRVEPCDLALYADQRKIKQVVLNLVANAVKYTPEGGTIRIRAKRADDVVRVEVTDTGIGVPLAEQTKIFDEFHQAEKVRDEQLGGTGIGLALCRRLVLLHGGDIGVISEVGKGSTFWFTLPVRQPPPRTRAEGANPGAIPASQPQGRRILVAEDNEANLTLILDLLSLHGHHVVVARNGEEAVELAVSHHPELILMDMRMPRMDGIAATRKLRGMPEFRHTPIVALSASAGYESEKMHLEAGCTAHLSKPISVLDLSAVLARYLQGEARKETTTV